MLVVLIKIANDYRPSMGLFVVVVVSEILLTILLKFGGDS
jgi:hypothetical protein